MDDQQVRLKLSVYFCLLALTFVSHLKLFAASPPENVLSAAHEGDLDTVKKWVENNSNDVDAYGWGTRTLLHLAAGEGHIDIVDWLLTQKADANRVGDGFASSHLKQTPLHVAAWLGRTSVVERLIKAGAKINARDAREETPLHFAVVNGSAEVVKALLAAGADVNATNQNGKTPHVYARGANTNLMELLPPPLAHLQLSNSLPVVRETGLSLHDAIARHELIALSGLAKQGANLEQRDELGRTPLLLALNNNNIEAMEILLTLGANIQATNAEGNSPLHIAALTCFEWSDDKDMAELFKDAPFWARWGNKTGLYLLSKNADVRATNNLGRTPFHMVGLRFDRGKEASPEVEALVTNLLHYKADINARDNSGVTPLHLAVRTGGYPLVHALLANGADVNLEDNKRRTALHYALGAEPDLKSKTSRVLLDTGSPAKPSRLFPTSGFFRPDSDIIRLLLRAKADTRAADAEGKTPLSLAEETGDEILIQLLKGMRQ